MSRAASLSHALNAVKGRTPTGPGLLSARTRAFVLFAASVVAVLHFFGAAPVSAAGFRPITAEQKAFERAEFDPEAVAVVLFRHGRLRMMDYPVEMSSVFEVEERIKVLTEAGKSAGEVEIPHSRFYRLKSIEGRTVLADGRVVELPEDAIFKERRSRSDKYFVTKIAFPAVEVGAILDFKYEMRWDSFLFLEPWYFDDNLPTLLSEITYVIPDRMSIKPWSLRSSRIEMNSEMERAPGERRFRVWMENLRGLPQEPHSLPGRALASRIMMVPTSVNVGGDSIRLLESWKRTVELFDDQYVEFSRRKSKTKARAAELARAEPSVLAQIKAIFAFVRDEIRTQDRAELGIAEGRRADAVLTEKQGSETEKALVLKVMLGSLKLKPVLVWAARRSEGRIDMSVANPWWFDRILVSVEVEGERLFLDPSERGLAAGRLAPDFEGAQALILYRDPEVITLPSSAFDQSTRRVQIALTLDADGRVAGTGTMTLGGHHASRRLRWMDDDEETKEAWSDWIEERYPGYEVEEVSVEESVDDQRVRVGWSLFQREEEVLGDEATLALSRPLGPTRQPFILEPMRRMTPALMNFADRDELVVEVSWPEEWEVEVLPKDRRFDSSAGSLEARLEHDAVGRSLRYSRRVDIRQALFSGPDEYKVIRDLFDWIEKSDAQRLVLAAP